MLIDLTELKDYLQVTGTESDAILTLLSEFAVSELETVLDRTLVTTTVTNEILEWPYSKFDGMDSREIKLYQPYNELFLDNWPVNQFNELAYNGEAIDASKYAVDLTLGVIKMFEWVNDYKNRLTASYVYGYTADTLPSVLKMVLFEGVKQYYQENDNARRGKREASSKRLGDFSVEYEDSATNVSDTQGMSNFMKRYLANNLVILKRFTKINV